MKRGKKYRAAVARYDRAERFSLDRAVGLLKEVRYASFDETVEVHVSLRLKKNQTVRDTVVLPHRFRADVRVLVFCKEDRVSEALAAGAAYAGGAEYLEKVKGGWFDFDVVVASPDMMKDVGRLGMVLGRRGLMPNPRTGTVSADLGAAVCELKKGRVEFRADKTGVVHLAVGKTTMDSAQIVENVDVFLSEMDRKKPVDVKAGFVRSISLSSSMGPGIWVVHKSEE